MYFTNTNALYIPESHQNCCSGNDECSPKVFLSWQRSSLFIAHSTDPTSSIRWSVNLSNILPHNTEFWSNPHSFPFSRWGAMWFGGSCHTWRGAPGLSLVKQPINGVTQELPAYDIPLWHNSTFRNQSSFNHHSATILPYGRGCNVSSHNECIPKMLSVLRRLQICMQNAKQNSPPSPQLNPLCCPPPPPSGLWRGKFVFKNKSPQFCPGTHTSTWSAQVHRCVGHFEGCMLGWNFFGHGRPAGGNPLQAPLPAPPPRPPSKVLAQGWVSISKRGARPCFVRKFAISNTILNGREACPHGRSTRIPCARSADPYLHKTSSGTIGALNSPDTVDQVGDVLTTQRPPCLADRCASRGMRGMCTTRFLLQTECLGLEDAHFVVQASVHGRYGAAEHGRSIPSIYWNAGQPSEEGPAPPHGPPTSQTPPPPSPWTQILWGKKISGKIDSDHCWYTAPPPPCPPF